MTVPRVVMSPDDDASPIGKAIWPKAHPYQLVSMMSYFLWQVGSGEVRPEYITVWEDWMGNNPDKWSV